MCFFKCAKSLLVIAAFSATLVGCSHSPSQPSTKALTPPPLATLQDFQLQQSTNQALLSVNELAEQVRDADVIFVGEYHSHSASHNLQTQLISALYQHNSDLILSMEQFTRDKQEVVNQYLKGEIGEQTLIKDGDAWDNYPSDYRPLVEFAREHSLPVIAANTPIKVVRCVAKQGPEVLAKFSADHQAWVAEDIQTSSTAYQQKFQQAMGGHGGKHRKHGKDKAGKHPGKHGGATTHKAKLSNSFYAQLSRDNTMAESIYRALKAAPKSQVMHTNGAFHSDFHLGTVDALKRLDSKLKIIVISPQFTNEEVDWSRGDYVYRIQAMPTRYIKSENQNKAIMRMMKKRKNAKCELI